MNPDEANHGIFLCRFCPVHTYHPFQRLAMFASNELKKRRKKTKGKGKAELHLRVPTFNDEKFKRQPSHPPPVPPATDRSPTRCSAPTDLSPPDYAL
jgi:hypothetical protein